VYSISEIQNLAVPVKLRAHVNWWLDPASATNGTGVAGERVSGPMTVFDGVLYFATYGAAAPGSSSCTSGDGRVWGLDFVKPFDGTTPPSKGGLPRLLPVPPNPRFVQPDSTDSQLLGMVIPGVSIKATPACADLGAPGNDSYVAGASHASPQHFTTPPSQYSVFTQTGTNALGGYKTKPYSLQVPTPVAPTLIDSWAAVLE
jgi:type IV pilus assembly protein PilY1